MLFRQSHAALIFAMKVLLERKKKCLTRTSSEITNKAEHFSITEIGRRHDKVSKITHF